MTAALDHDRIYCEIDRTGKDGRSRGVLRVSVSLDWGDKPKVHVREWVHTSKDPFALVPCRGIALTLEELDAVILALGLAREDAAHGGFRRVGA